MFHPAKIKALILLLLLKGYGLDSTEATVGKATTGTGGLHRSKNLLSGIKPVFLFFFKAATELDLCRSEKCPSQSQQDLGEPDPIVTDLTADCYYKLSKQNFVSYLMYR